MNKPIYNIEQQRREQALKKPVVEKQDPDKSEDERIQDASEESFPASDSPAFNSTNPDRQN